MTAERLLELGISRESDFIINVAVRELDKEGYYEAVQAGFDEEFKNFLAEEV